MLEKELAQVHLDRILQMGQELGLNHLLLQLVTDVVHLKNKMNYENR
jgi:hypothetical protein